MDDIRRAPWTPWVQLVVVNGVSEGGPMAIMFAATGPPQWVTALTLFGTFARILEDEDYDGSARGRR